jgi:ERCC4-type nuclease
LGIFWQTARTTRASRPGIRVPGRRASWLSDITILVDTRERYPYKFAKQQASTVRHALPVGDYGILFDDRLVALVERKSLQDLAKSLTEGTLAYQLADLATYPRAAVVVEERYSAVFKHEHVPGGWLADLLARHQVRYPTVPIVFCETRPLTEEWTFRFLGAALAHHLDQPSNPTAPRDMLGRPGPSDSEQ